jgi:hypothetical protein
MYAAELNDNVVVRVIVGTAEWAQDNLGGVWQDSPKIGPGWTWHHDHFRPPACHDDCPWDDGWHCQHTEDEDL